MPICTGLEGRVTLSVEALELGVTEMAASLTLEWETGWSFSAELR